jgi:Protein of unknown function (DUF4079)
LIDRSIISYLRYAHGSYNILVYLLFLHQGWLGIRIRRERRQGLAPTVRILRRHRKFGPILSVIGIIGFISGLIVIFIDNGIFFVFRLHFITGFLISIFISIAYLSSRKIKARDSVWRTPHLTVGIIIICLYFIQIFLGIGVLF